MECPNCGSLKSKVLDVRTVLSRRRRRRKCLSCDVRFTTYEITRRSHNETPFLSQEEEKVLKTIPEIIKILNSKILIGNLLINDND